MTCLYLLHDALLVVVPQRAAQLVIVHGRSVLLDPPEPSHLTTRWDKFLLYNARKGRLHHAFLIEILKCSVRGFDRLTSSGSMSLNSMFLPVQMIRCLLAGLSSSVSRNCQSCREPRRWYGRPSCFTLPAYNATQDTMYTSLIIRLGSPNSLYSSQIISKILKFCP